MKNFEAKFTLPDGEVKNIIVSANGMNKALEMAEKKFIATHKGIDETKFTVSIRQIKEEL